jgi:hypothetical protein
LRIKPLVAVVTTAAAIAALAVGMSYAAHADTAGWSQADLDYVQGQLQAHGVPQKTRQKLMADFVVGKRWESEKANAKPVSTENAAVDGFQQTTFRYSDGSVAVSKMEIPRREDISTSSINGCKLAEQRNDVKRWTGCKVGWDTITWHVEFTANYGIYQFGSWIDSVNGLSFGGAGSSFSDGKTEILVKNGSGRGTPAIAQGKVIQHTPIFSRTVGVQVNVRADWNGGRSSIIEG